MAEVGYIRVSSTDQNTRRQLEGVHLDKVFSEKISGGNAARLALRECLNYLREGDTLHVHSLDRLARSLADLKKIVADLTEKGVTIFFHKEVLTFSPAGTTPLDTLLFHVLGAFAEFERSLIRTRQKEGIAAAKRQGVHLGRPPVSTEKRLAVVESLKKQEPPKNISKKYGISVSTIYRIKRQEHL